VPLSEQTITLTDGWPHYERLLARVVPPIANLVLLIRDDVPVWANRFAERCPGAVVHVLGARRELTPDEYEQLNESIRYTFAPSLRSRLDYLMRMPRPEIIIEAGNKKRAHKLSSFQHLYHFVRANGYYAVDELDACQDKRYDDAIGTNVLGLLGEVAAVRAMSPLAAADAKVGVQELAAGTNEITFSGTRAVARRSEREQFLKLRDWEADEVLTRRYGTAWGEVVHTRPAETFVSRAHLTSHGDGPIPSGAKTFQVPDRYLRRYREVTCTARQILRRGEFVLPDSWRHPHQPNLNNRQLVQSSSYFGRYLERTEPTSTRRLPGAYVYLDTELPGHFGHITTDVISRVWSWDVAVRENPSVRPLVSIARPPKELPRYQQQIFAALGVPVEGVEIIGPREAVEVEILYGGTPQLENPYYIDPALTAIWRRLAENLPPSSAAAGEKIFVSRRPSDKRHCAETGELEAFFAERGFSILFPEDHSYPDQKAIFARARVIAGFGGSGMFNIMFAPDAVIVLISGTSYNAENEHLIAAANGNEIHYFWGRSYLSMPPGRFSYDAFRSGFTFDLRQHRRSLRQIVG
jgi:capsular polysaccharide biosynthesis protein